MITINNITQPTSLSSHDFIDQYKDAAYTTLRTVNRNSIFRLQQHVERLYTAIEKHSSLKLSSEQIRQQIVQQTTNYLKLMNEGELRVYFIASYQTSQLQNNLQENIQKIQIASQQPSIDSYCEQLTTAPPTSAFRSFKITRPDPQIKDLTWVQLRKKAELLLNKDVNEAIIYNESNEITEGLSSNVFVIIDNIVYTAPDSMVLTGTMRDLVIRVIQEYLGLKIVFAPVQIQDLSKAKEVFVCSTSRYVVCGTGVDNYVLKCEIGLQVRAEVIRRMTEESEVVVE